MLISDTVKRVLIENSVKLDTNRDYTVTELISLQEKIITFLNRKLQQAKVPVVDVEDECPVNLEEQQVLILNDIETMTASQLCETYSKQWFLSNHKDCNYLAAMLLCENAEKYGYVVTQLWKDVLANGGNVKNTEGVI